MYKNDIGIDAGTIWYLLAGRGAPAITEIRELTSDKNIFINLASD